MAKGDALAAGAIRATFGPANVSQEKWDAMWESEDVKPDCDALLEADRILSSDFRKTSSR